MKIEEQVLSREQMANLVELGVDTSDASMIWVSVLDNPQINDWFLAMNDGFLAQPHNVPTYTIGDLIEKLPKSENIGTLLIEFGHSDLGYGVWTYLKLHGIYGRQNFEDKPLKDALYDLLCWVAENHNELIK